MALYLGRQVEKMLSEPSFRSDRLRSPNSLEVTTPTTSPPGPPPAAKTTTEKKRKLRQNPRHYFPPSTNHDRRVMDVRTTQIPSLDQQWITICIF